MNNMEYDGQQEECDGSIWLEIRAKLARSVGIGAVELEEVLKKVFPDATKDYPNYFLDMKSNKFWIDVPNRIYEYKRKTGINVVPIPLPHSNVVLQFNNKRS